MLGILFTACDDSKKTTKTNQAVKKVQQTKYILKGIDNKNISIVKKDGGFILEDDPKKIVIFDIFATWCPPCRAEAEVLSNLEKKYKNDIKIIGITIQKNISNEELLDFAHTYNASYFISNSKENSKLIDEIVKALNIGERFPIPMMVMYKDAKIVNYYLGATEEEFIESDIKQALGK
jgi:thiol-disulfide isomerase/thioredoxin